MTALILKTVITTYLRALPNPLYITLLISTYCNTLVNSATVIYFNCGKDGYFILFYLKLKVISNIKEIKKEKISNKLKKKIFREKLPSRVPY